MSLSLDSLRRAARALQSAHAADDPQARRRLLSALGTVPNPLKHADALHVIARETGFPSWPRLKRSVEREGMDRAAAQARLGTALRHGQTQMAEELLSEWPDLARGRLELEIALYDLGAVEAALAADPGAATRPLDGWRPICHLAFSRWIHVHPDRAEAMLAIAARLVAGGADVNDAIPGPGAGERLPVLYGAIGHADNMALGRWLLARGADPNDGESLYHATELGHRQGLRMLLEAGADPRGTNALLRAMDFGDHAAVALLLAHGARADEDGAGAVPALHHAARRMCDRAMVEALLDAGADPARRWQGVTAYALARVHGNGAVARALADRGADRSLTEAEALLASAAEGRPQPGRWLDPARLPDCYRNLVRELLVRDVDVGHLQRLAALGLETDRPDAQGVTPVQIAGWEGLPHVMAWLLTTRPDLSHVNGYGGTLLTTIIHGSENAPDRAARDHVGCARLALEHGVALPRAALSRAGAREMRAFLNGWATRHPGAVVDDAIR
ncbi:ankyrin repeat domain-containing protein [Rhodobacteraceae bacterium CCMM004]|nr:ankyrin repeat domain-containing protein [Rhodobacteraceae bacterium CCMM004]